MSQFNSLGEFLTAVRRDAAMGEASRPDPRLHTRAASGANEAIPSDGGFAVSPMFAPKLIERLYQTGEILGRCMEMPITDPRASGIKFPQLNESSRANGSRMGGVQAYWAKEAATLTPTRPKFGLCEMEAEKLIALVYLTDELAMDSGALEAFAMAAFAKEMAFVFENALINGDGIGKPLGVRNSAATITQTKESGQTAGTIVANNITNMWGRLWAPSRKNAVWIVNQEAEQQLLPLQLAGKPLYRPTEDPDKQPYNLILGRPVITLEHCPVVGTPGDIMLCDFSRVVLAVKESLNATASIHVKFLTNEQVLRFTMRANAQPIDIQPVTPLNGTLTTSPFVQIESR